MLMTFYNFYNDFKQCISFILFANLIHLNAVNIEGGRFSILLDVFNCFFVIQVILLLLLFSQIIVIGSSYS